MTIKDTLWPTLRTLLKKASQDGRLPERDRGLAGAIISRAESNGHITKRDTQEFEHILHILLTARDDPELVKAARG